MRHPVLTATAALLLVLQHGCADPAGPADPSGLAPSLARGGVTVTGGGVRRIQMLDACDPASFDAVLGAGACTRPGGLAFGQFIELLTRHGTIASWRFSPANAQLDVGETLVAINAGGEVHTFTEVREFGGGIVPDLNALTGDLVPAPECLNFGALEFIPPGGTDTEVADEPGTERYMCCIHPWMRAEVHVRGG